MKGRLNHTEGAAHLDRYFLGEWIDYKASTEACQRRIEINNQITFDSTEEFIRWANSLGYHRICDDNDETNNN